MKMKITGMTEGTHRILILHTDGRAPTQKELALFFTRSITILGEYYLVGPTDTGAHLAFDADGQPVPLSPIHRDFLANGWRYHPMVLSPLEELLALKDKLTDRAYIAP